MIPVPLKYLIFAMQNSSCGTPHNLDGGNRWHNPHVLGADKKKFCLVVVDPEIPFYSVFPK
jgi:hypothetical protein